MPILDIQEITHSGATLHYGRAMASFVSATNGTWLITAGFGAVFFWQYNYSTGQWVEKDKITTGDFTAAMISVAMCETSDGTLWAFAGDPLYTGTYSAEGCIRCFKLVSGSWSEQSLLPHPSPQQDANFGWGDRRNAVTAHSDLLVAGCCNYDGPSKTDSGNIVVFEYSGGSWGTGTVFDNITSVTLESYDYLGSSVAICNYVANDNCDIIVGAPGDDTGTGNEGAIYAVRKVTGTWTERARLVPNTASNGHLGRTLAATPTGNRFGALVEKNTGWLYTYMGSDQTWTKEADQHIWQSTVGDGFCMYGANAFAVGDASHYWRLITGTLGCVTLLTKIADEDAYQLEERIVVPDSIAPQDKDYWGTGVSIVFPGLVVFGSKETAFSIKYSFRSRSYWTCSAARIGKWRLQWEYPQGAYDVGSPQGEYYAIHAIADDNVWVGMLLWASGVPILHNWGGSSWTTHTLSGLSITSRVWVVTDIDHAATEEGDTVLYVVARDSGGSGNSLLLSYDSTNGWQKLAEVAHDFYVICALGIDDVYVGGKNGDVGVQAGLWHWDGSSLSHDISFPTDTTAEATIVGLSGVSGKSTVYAVRDDPDSDNSCQIWEGSFGSWATLYDPGNPVTPPNNKLWCKSVGFVMYAGEEPVSGDDIVSVYDGDSWTDHNIDDLLADYINMPNSHGLAASLNFSDEPTILLVGGLQSGVYYNGQCWYWTENNGGWGFRDVSTPDPIGGADPAPPVITPMFPSSGTADAEKDTDIIFSAIDDAEGTGVVLETIQAWLNGLQVIKDGEAASNLWAVSFEEVELGYIATISHVTRPTYFEDGEQVNLRAYCEDTVGNSDDKSWSFWVLRELGLRIYPMLFEGIRKIDESYD